MSEKKMPSAFGGRFIGFCDERAKSMSLDLISVLQESKDGSGFDFSEEDVDLLAFCLSDMLVHFFWDAIKLHAHDPDGLKRLNRITARLAARRSAEKRSKASVKQKFLEYALQQNSRNPGLSKGAVAEMYARDNPGTSVATLRRYLAAIPNKEVD